MVGCAHGVGSVNQAPVLRPVVLCRGPLLSTVIVDRSRRSSQRRQWSAAQKSPGGTTQAVSFFASSSCFVLRISLVRHFVFLWEMEGVGTFSPRSARNSDAGKCARAACFGLR